MGFTRVWFGWLGNYKMWERKSNTAIIIKTHDNNVHYFIHYMNKTAATDTNKYNYLRYNGCLRELNINRYLINYNNKTNING